MFSLLIVNSQLAIVQTVLAHAASSGKGELVSMLLEAKAALEATDISGWVSVML